MAQVDIDSVIDKIKKAIRLANKTTSDGERETALRLARQLAEKNGVAFDDVVDEASEDKAVMDRDAECTTIPGSEFGYACFIVKQHFGVIIMRGMVRGQSARKSRLSWIGSRLNIDIAKHVYHILMRESGRAFRAVKKTHPVDRPSFMRGFFWALHEKLTERPLRNDLPASIKAAERRLLAYMQDGHEVKERGGSPAKMNAKNVASLMAGIDAGRSVNLARPCEGRNPSPFALGVAV